MPASRKARWIVGIVFVASAIGLSAPAAVAVERHVPGEYATIQAAIDACADGDEVIIAPGTYTGEGSRDIDFNGKAITVRSTDPGDPAGAHVPAYAASDSVPRILRCLH